MVAFRVREHERDIKGAPGHEDCKGYWVYCSDIFYDYYEALKYAVEWSKTTYPCWVEALIDDEW